MLYRVVKNNINNKNQYNYAIEYEPHFDSIFSFSGRNNEPLPVATVRPQGG